MKFPYFPWINLENAVKHGMRNHYVYNLATCRRTVRHLAACARAAEVYPDQRKAIYHHLKKRYGYTYGNFCFGYDAARYGEWYNDRLKMLHIWEAIETYAQLYFIYVIQSSLTISNYAIRTDSLYADAGNFPRWDMDFFSRDARTLDADSRYSHIIDFDALRLGKKLAANNELADSFEFGVINITEVGKERKNALLPHFRDIDHAEQYHGSGEATQKCARTSGSRREGGRGDKPKERRIQRLAENDTSLCDGRQFPLCQGDHGRAAPRELGRGCARSVRNRTYP